MDKPMSDPPGSPQSRVDISSTHSGHTSAPKLLWWLRDVHIWLLAGMLAVAGLMHYSDAFPPLAAHSPSALTSPSMVRILFLLPIIYGGFVFGVRGGVVTLVLAIMLMVPQAVFRSPSPASALTEVGGVTLVGILTVAWFEAQQKEKEHRHRALDMLETARLELGAHVETVKSNEKRLRTIQEVCSLLTQAPELGPTLRQVLSRVIEVVAVDAGLVFLLDQGTNELNLAAHQGVSEDFARSVALVRLGEGFNGGVAKMGKHLIVEDYFTDPRLSQAHVKREGLRSQLIVPLNFKGQSIGTLCVATRARRTFTPDEVNLVAAIGDQLGIAIENARLYQSLRASEENYRELFENSPVAIFLCDLSGHIVDVNMACVRLTAYGREELVGSWVGRLYAAGSAQKAREMEAALLQGEGLDFPYELHLIKNGGSEAIISATARLITKAGQPAYFEYIIQDVTEQRRMQENLEFYMRQVLTAQEAERKRIARELHDETAQSLLIISQRLDALASDPHNDLAGEMRTYLESVREVTVKTLSDLRHLTQDLRPRILDDLGLVAAIEWLADDLGKQEGLSVSVRVNGAEPVLRPEAQLLLFRIAQEAISNVRRHAAASQVNILLECGQDKVRLTIEDNGKGFKLPSKIADLAVEGKLGILGMHERARLLNGSVSVRSQPGQGTTVIAELPA